MDQLLLKLRKELKRQADPQKAPAMQAYMKSKMPYHGVPAPLVKKICKDIFAEFNFLNRQIWQEQVLSIWNNAEYREERYSALKLAADKRAHVFHVPSAMKMYEKLIVTGAWWDYVDDLAHRVGFILEKHPEKMKPKMLIWSRSNNIWKRRTAIISQLTFGEKTDLKFLYSCIRPSLDSKEFFLQKAIGWSLRQYAWTNPKEVIRYVKENENKLSALSRREALKNV